MRNYEIMFIVNPNATDEEIDKINGQIEGIITAGGHNGIKSIISSLGSDEFLRIRVGIQPEREMGDVRDFVLSRVGKSDRTLLDQTEEIAIKAAETLIAEGIEKAMAEYNGIDLREAPEGAKDQ